MRTQITQAEILDAHGDRLRGAMYHCLPGIVQNYYPDTQEADVQPAIHDVRTDPDSAGDRVSEPWPTLPRVPIAWPKFGGYVVAGPLAAGNRVLLLAFDLDPTQHRLTGDAEDPLDASRHAGKFWVAYPCDITDPGRIQDHAAAGDALVIGKDGATQQIRIDGSNISLGAGASDFVALASKVATELGKIAATLATGGNSGGPVVFGTPYTTPGSVASALVKCQ